MTDMTEQPSQHLWEVSAEHVRNTIMGRPRIFRNPEELLEAVQAYFQWVADNPLKEAKFYTSDGEGKTKDMDKLRVMSVWALCSHMGVSDRTWRAWKDPGHARFREDLVPVIDWAEKQISSQQLEGASAGLLKEQIISRLLGLADKKEHSGPDGGEIPISGSTSKVELARMIAFALSEGAKEVEENG